MKINKVRGTADLYGDDLKLFEFILDEIKKLSVKFSFQQIETPILEYSEVFHRSLGDLSDIVKKETYSFQDRDKRSLTLRPEFTAAMVRAVIENGMLQNLPLKLFSYGSLFRHERPQKCRLRQFHQFDFEYIAANHKNVDLELLLLAQSILDTFKIDNIKLHFNSLGSLDDKAKYKYKLVEYFNKYSDKLSKISQERLIRNPLRILDSKEEQDQDLIANAPNISEFININERKKLDYIGNKLSEIGVDSIIQPKLVRGLDYYTSFVFEFITEDLGSQGAVIAGGRYDNLINQMGGNEVAASGFAGGIERIMALTSKEFLLNSKITLIYLIPIGEKAEEYSVLLSNKLRIEYNLKIEIHYGLSLKKRMQKANKLCASHTVIFGEEELANKSFKVKDMHSRTEKVIAENKLTDYLINL